MGELKIKFYLDLPDYSQNYHVDDLNWRVSSGQDIGY